MRGPYAKSEPLITAKQVTMLIITAQQAYFIAQKNGVDEGLKFDDWRKSLLEDEFHTTSFKKLTSRDFNRALNVYRRYTGEALEEEFKGRNDDIPYRKKAWYILRQNIKDAGVNAAYVKTIMERKFKMVVQGDDNDAINKAVMELRAKQIEQLAWTIKNRKKNKKEPETAENRDKKQRHERAARKTTKRYYSLDDTPEADN